MNKPEIRLGDRLVQAGYITDEQLDTAVELQKRDGGLLGDCLIRYGYLTAYQLSDFIYQNQFSRLGELLIQDRKITRDQLEKALDYQKQNGGRIGSICVHLGLLSQDSLEQTLQKHSRDKGRLGDILLRDGILTQEQLNNALNMQRRSGGRLGDILLFLRYVDQETLCRELANQFELGRLGDEVDLAKVRKLPYRLADKHKAIVVSEWKDAFLLAVPNRLDDAAVGEIASFLRKPVEQVLATPEEMSDLWDRCYKKIERHKSVFDLYDNQPQNSAIVTFSTPQLITLIVLGIAILVGILVDWFATLFVVNMAIQIVYALMTILKLYLVLRGEDENSQLRFTREELEQIDEKDLPVYTVLIPVYHETEVIRTLLRHIASMDYPSYKLDVRVLLEEDDLQTIEAVRAIQKSGDIPFEFSPIIVPKSQPQTKPKACNYGLLQARGEYVVIYDAEDRPEPDQLKKAYLSFQMLPEEFVCIQAKLNYYNSDQNFLTKLFTQEYSMWFENLLVGVMQMDIPVPLGGTSNHFKMSFLREVGGWDPFNVTEDADLGVRLFKFRYKTAVLDSRTWEEANSNLKNWTRQRSRWIKGYMQTWFVHMRHPVQLFRELGLRGFIGYQAMVFGTPVLPLINPFLWLMMILWFATKAWWIQYLFPGFLYYISMIQLIFGNFMFTYINMVGMYSVIRDCNLKKQQSFSYSLIKYALLTPAYWALMSVAAYKALFQLLRKPFYWEKTIHGLDEPAAENEGENTG
ncbi:Glycosyltransferase like family 2 [Caprobacter fermentans]|uniref:Glycosyltransferase like family 2 n=1 Tax=Caproicibacter fermentans TaxID=2576756 RepID=A0A6N8HW91_9FIRM|nr:glycosyltransferase family 2 protein [Caproicibacter fermentans]MVB09928.1 Glycosyltransferase like family 2 [Caproicibacter fermentans]